MELKHVIMSVLIASVVGLLIVPYGIETFVIILHSAQRYFSFNRTLWN